MPTAAVRDVTARLDMDGPTTPRAILDAVHGAVDAALAACDEPLVLAVSGGIDSMVLMEAAARARPGRIAAVATFDHRSGPYAQEAAAFVRREGERRGFRVTVGRARREARSEAAWRAERWVFLRGLARDMGARVATAHTADDQVETVCIRILRDSGARGLAGLYARSDVVRPLLGFRRGDIQAYAAALGLRHVEDPTNTSMRFLRNRLRRDLLPAIARLHPSFAAEVTRLAARAADVRAALDEVARRLSIRGPHGDVAVSLADVADITAEGLEALAPSWAAAAGIVLDHRGTTRLSQFILSSRTSARIQLSGGAEALRTRDCVTIRRIVPRDAGERPLSVAGETMMGRWRFRRAEPSQHDDPWTAELPADRALTLREWRAGDRMRAVGSRAARRVKRFFSDAGIAGPERDGWPVVLADGEIVWIPGVRRSDAATDRSGRPVLRYRCERNDV